MAEIKYEMPRVRESAKLAWTSKDLGKEVWKYYVVDVKFRDLKSRMSFQILYDVRNGDGVRYHYTHICRLLHR